MLLLSFCYCEQCFRTSNQYIVETRECFTEWGFLPKHHFGFGCKTVALYTLTKQTFIPYLTSFWSVINKVLKYLIFLALDVLSFLMRPVCYTFQPKPFLSFQVRQCLPECATVCLRAPLIALEISSTEFHSVPDVQTSRCRCQLFKKHRLKWTQVLFNAQTLLW